MKLTQLLIAGLLAGSMALPLAASAQQAPPPPQQQPYGYPQQQPYGYPQQQQPGQPGQGRGLNQATPSAYQMQRQFGRMFQNLNVTGQQQSQITSLINAYSQQHPEGSPRDRLSMKQLRQQILSVLSPQQQQQYEQERAAMQTQRAERHQQRVQQQQQQQQQQQPQQAPPQGQPVPPGQPPLPVI